MKKFSFILIAIAATFISCSKINEPIAFEAETEPEYIEVSVKSFIDNIELVSETPVKSGTSSNDLYGISIIQYCGDNIMYYCRAIYDDITLLKSIKLVKGAEYTLSASYMPNGKIICPHYGTRESDANPFQLEGAAANPMTMPLNTIVYDQYVFLEIGFPSMTIHDADYYLYEYRHFIADENKPIEINYRHMVGSLKFNFVAEEGYSYDKVVVKCSDSYYNKTVTLVNGKGTFEIPTITMWRYENEEESYNFSFDSTDETIFWRGDVSIKYNTKREYNVKLKPQGKDTPIIVNISDDDVTNENMGTLN